MLRYTDDPISDYAAYEAELVRLEQLVPRCFKCKKPIMDDYYYEVEEGVPLCADCLDRHYKKRVEVI